VERLRPREVLGRRGRRGAPAVGAVEQAAVRLGLERQAEQTRLLPPHLLQQRPADAVVGHLEEAPLRGRPRYGVPRAAAARQVDHGQLALQHGGRAAAALRNAAIALAVPEQREVALGQRRVGGEAQHMVDHLAWEMVVNLLPSYKDSLSCVEHSQDEALMANG
jgi:hypothetical protein